MSIGNLLNLTFDPAFLGVPGIIGLGSPRGFPQLSSFFSTWDLVMVEDEEVLLSSTSDVVEAPADPMVDVVTVVTVRMMLPSSSVSTSTFLTSWSLPPPSAPDEPLERWRTLGR